MGSVEDKVKHSRRLKRKKVEAAKRQEGLRPGRVRSVIAKELIVSGKYKQKIVKDKRGKKHDLEKLDHLSFVELLQDLNKDA